MRTQKWYQLSMAGVPEEVLQKEQLRHLLTIKDDSIVLDGVKLCIDDRYLQCFLNQDKPVIYESNEGYVEFCSYGNYRLLANTCGLLMMVNASEGTCIEVEISQSLAYNLIFARINEENDDEIYRDWQMSQ